MGLVNPYLVMVGVDPRDLPDDVMEMVEKEVSNGRESTAELERKIEKNWLKRFNTMQQLHHCRQMLNVWQSVLVSSEKDGDTNMLEEAKLRVEGFEAKIPKVQSDLERLNAIERELEQQIIDEPKMRHIHRQLFQHD